ncbi:MAG: hypothetical protein V3T14_05905 [Myxococcota bacterium]
MRYGVVWALSLSLVGCATSRLPEEARGRATLIRPSDADLTDLISYRTLTRGDFKADAPPPSLSHPERMGALTCGYVMPAPETQAMVSHIRQPDGTFRYEGSVRNLGFRAVMNRNCSWWNDDFPSFSSEYVLEHEQIHFAIVEIGARRANERADEIARSIRSRGRDYRAAGEKTQGKFEAALGRLTEQIMNRHTRFDEDTSLGHFPEKQREWLERIERELAETSP